MKKVIGLLFVSMLLGVGAASAQSCPKVEFLAGEGDTFVEGGTVFASFAGSRKIRLSEYTYTWTLSAGKVKQESANDYHMSIDTAGLAPGTRIDVQVTATKGSCRSSASTWFVIGGTKGSDLLSRPAVLPTPNGKVTALPEAFPLPTPGPCPKVSVQAPDRVDAGRTLTFKAILPDVDKNDTPTYNWSVSAGTIESGQGTAEIKLDTTGIGGQAVTATVEIFGIYTCQLYKSATAIVSDAAVEGRKFDEFRHLGPKESEFERLDALILMLKSEPTAKAHLILYLGVKGLPGAVKAWNTQTVNYLIKNGIAKARITSVDGGYRENGMIEAWIIPPGAPDPDPSPTLDPSEIVKPKPKPKPGRRV